MTHKKITSKMKLAKSEDLVARALRQYAAQLIHRQSLGLAVPVEEARDLDRALRSCRGVTDGSQRTNYISTGAKGLGT